MANSQKEQQLSEVVFSWKHQDLIKYRRTTSWYVISTIVVALLVWWSIGNSWWMGGQNYLFAVFIVIFFLVVLLLDYREAKAIEFYITPDGIKDAGKFYSYDELDHFFVIYKEDGVKSLYVEFKNPLRGRLAIPLDDQDVIAIRDYLLKHLKENLDRETEPLTDIIRRLLKF
jgi:hypothetical protein